ncbi:MAG: PrsW family glutamic-type intramembrane protease [Phycisphaerales bacterium]
MSARPGYAFTSFLRSQGSLSVTVAVTLLRGILSPLGHGTWTAILAAVLFRESRDGRFRFNAGVRGAFLTVIVLHGLWDALPGIVSTFVQADFDIFIAQMTVGAIGLLILWRRWREAVQLQDHQFEMASVP